MVPKRKRKEPRQKAKWLIFVIVSQILSNLSKMIGISRTGGRSGIDKITK
jgi:hypothetical protein